MTPETAAALIADVEATHDAPAWRYVDHVTPNAWVVTTFDGTRHVITVTVVSGA